MTYSDL